MSSTYIIGLGSPYGDDQVGWRVIDLLCEQLGTEDGTRNFAKAATPAHLLDLLEGGERLVLIDACQGLGPPGKFRCLTWPDSQIRQLRSAAGHLLSLHDAIQLAQAIGKSPTSCEVWCIEGVQFEVDAPMSAPVIVAAEKVALELSAKHFAWSKCHA
jgi:hydrogenase maturation protease